MNNANNNIDNKIKTVVAAVTIAACITAATITAYTYQTHTNNYSRKSPTTYNPN